MDEIKPLAPCLVHVGSGYSTRGVDVSMNIVLSERKNALLTHNYALQEQISPWTFPSSRALSVDLPFA